MADILTAFAAVFAFILLPMGVLWLMAIGACIVIAPAIWRAIASSSNQRAKWATVAVLSLLQISWIAFRALPSWTGANPENPRVERLDALLVVSWCLLLVSLRMFKVEKIRATKVSDSTKL